VIEAFAGWLAAAVPAEVVAMYRAALRVYGEPSFFGLVAVVLFLERVRPAIKDQRVFSAGFAQDFLWFNLDGIFKLAIFPAHMGLLKAIYDRVTGGFAFTGSDAWPVAVTALVAFLLSDFLAWFHHFVRHHVPALWHFHVIHHSQRQMNLFTDNRQHWVEYFVATSITFVPLFLFPLDHPLTVTIATVQLWYTRFIHANVRTNFGPLRYVFVTPQSHRVHHSIEVKHRDRNFGVVLSIWDRMFGTLYPGYDEYPATGVEGVDFRPASLRSPFSWAASFWEQAVYPLRQLARLRGSSDPLRSHGG